MSENQTIQLNVDQITNNKNKTHNGFFLNFYSLPSSDITRRKSMLF